MFKHIFKEDQTLFRPTPHETVVVGGGGQEAFPSAYGNLEPVKSISALKKQKINA